MANIILSPMTPETLSASLAVNEQYVEMLSPLSVAGLQNLVDGACYAKQVGEGQGFLIAFDEQATYEGENYHWFKGRYNKFVYVDRIVIGDTLQRQGLAGLFYDDLITYAKNRAATHLCAEVNITPSNPASHAFHNKMGFEKVGEAHVGGKQVQYYAKQL